MAGDSAYCASLLEQEPLVLRTRVLAGPKAFNNLYLKRARIDGKTEPPLLTPMYIEAAHIFYHPTTRVLSAWSNPNQSNECIFTGLALIDPNPAAVDLPSDPHGDAGYYGNMGTQMMLQDGEKGFVWDDERFGGWLVCQTGQVRVLKWFDRKAGREVDEGRCARVELIPARRR